MKIFLRLFTPPIFLILNRMFKGFWGRLRLRNFQNVSYNSNNGRSIYIIGNGPSMNKTFELGLDILKNKDCLAVNNFSTSPFFTVVKPSSYVVADPIYMNNPISYAPILKERVEEMTKHLVDDVQWEMNVYLPDYSINSFFVQKLKSNNKLHLIFYNNNGGALDEYPKLYFKLLNRNLIAPLGQTVLNTSLSLCITMRYSNIYILGADSSWHEDYWMDQKTNELYCWSRHFYGTKKVKLCKDPQKTVPTRIHEELYSDSVAFKNYWILADYAKYNDVKVYNASASSWIDAFERKDLEANKQ